MVKLMEEPECTWLEYAIRKIYRTFHNYVVARKKLKDAEELSDINSGTEIKENLKKSRKIRAAKVIDKSSNEESSDDEMALISQLPKFSNKHSMTAEITKKALKITKDAQKGLHCNENVLDASAEQSFDDEINNTNVPIRQRDETSNPLMNKFALQ
ncbi:uncharacterized protein LOC105425076 [Pogonomyrmex barbatus]|uniref:Uncharacterized protein LOC105425076 n=1 Tax=Pogonomyrmex barbatus TaxID=144034 RepID=A0A6I9WQ59_9HYME|nr:uncharacterized protein LOC105425076 [Pogonomyrmex barbatus]XP_025073537.1 uncharacterized protein LOC105425076 [Pogonomyrmex barbatus]